MTKQNGVDVWSNAAIWMRDELRSKVRSFTYAKPYQWNQLPSSCRQPHSVRSPPGSPHHSHHLRSHHLFTVEIRSLMLNGNGATSHY